MSFDTDWDIEKYFDETEPEEHWELRKEFIMKHKEKYAEDYLVALAKVFTNVEFMGCSYSKELMTTIANLSEGVADAYRERQKTKLQRTFVQASDAAESKFAVKKTPLATQSGPIVKPNSLNDFKPKSQKLTKPRIQLEPSTNHTIHPKLNILKLVKNQSGVRGTIVLYINKMQETLPVHIIRNSIRKSGQHWKTSIQNIIDDIYDFCIGDEIIVSGPAKSKKLAEQDLSSKALNILKETCFTLERITEITDGIAVAKPGRSKPMQAKTDTTDLPVDNVGLKMMKLMGWAGKGLGKNETGRVDCIQAEQRISRRGLGDNSSSLKDIKKKLNNIVMEYAKTRSVQNLVFSSDFSKEERAHIHIRFGNVNDPNFLALVKNSSNYNGSDEPNFICKQEGGENTTEIFHSLINQLFRMIARTKYKLKSQSYGKQQGNRKLVLSQNVLLWDIVEDWLLGGPSIQTYNLILPSKFENKNM